MAMFDIVRFDGLTNREWLIYKYPKDSIVLGSQLIVQEGQVAIFVKQGTICDIFYPGTYTLSTENLPILNKIVNLPFGGKTPFSAEIYFVCTTVKLDINWGTSDPIQLIDPKYFVKLRIRAFGTMGLRVVDCATMFKELIGGMDRDSWVRFDTIKEYYKGILVHKVKALISEAIINEKISALEISAKLDDLSEKIKEKIEYEFEKYGFGVANFFIQSINFPNEDFDKINKILEDKAAFEIMGDNRYNTKRSFDVYEGAANNANGVAGAFAAGGMGFGMGMGMNGAMNQAMVNPMMNSQGGSLKECPECHQRLPMDAKFCNNCGYKFDAAPKMAQKECPGCHNMVNAGAKFCDECGFNFASLVCSGCGAQLEPGKKFCSECGTKVE